MEGGMTQIDRRRITAASPARASGCAACWWSAAVLPAGWPRQCCARCWRSDVTVTLVESDAIGIVGVGEATIPPMQQFQRFRSWTKPAFMAATQGTFKLGIEFHNWARQGDAYLHQFGAVGRELDAQVKLHHWWLAGRLADAGRGLILNGRRCTPRSTRQAEPLRPGGARAAAICANRYTHAYHFDAHLYAGYLRRPAEARGASGWKGASPGQSGMARRVSFPPWCWTAGERLEADLFIDCSGFASLLLGKELAEPFDRLEPLDPVRPRTGPAHAAGRRPAAALYARHRPCGRLAMAHPVATPHRQRPRFRQRLFERSEAEGRLLANLDAPDAGRYPAPDQVRHRAARARWVRNVVGLGLASGFSNRSNSTSIHFVQSALERLIELFPHPRDGPGAGRTSSTAGPRGNGPGARFHHRPLSSDRARGFRILALYPAYGDSRQPGAHTGRHGRHAASGGVRRAPVPARQLVILLIGQRCLPRGRSCAG